MPKVTIPTKVDRNPQTGNPNSLIVASDFNILVTAINALYDMFASITLRTCVAITAADFSGDNYQHPKLVNLRPDIDFRIFTNEGSGTLLVYDKDGYGEGGYAYNAATGTVTMPPQGYSIEIYSSIPVQ